MHRRRFVQDGDIPVTVLRRESGHDAVAPRTPSPTNAPVNNRLQRVETMLSTETAAREKAERALAETQSIVRDLQTKIGHAELARTEAVETLRREREVIAQLRFDVAQAQEHARQATVDAHATEQAQQQAHRSVLNQLEAESQARKHAEGALARSEAARERAEATVTSLAQQPALAQQASLEWTPPAPVASVKRTSDVATVSPAIRRRRAAQPAVAEQEPVKWWLATKSSPKRK
jgi:membrane protein involved in colicin uptake